MRMERWGFCLLVALFALSSTPLYAGWVPINQQYQSPGLRTVYFDPDSVRRDGHLVPLLALVDWKWMQGNRSPNRFYSTKITKQFDCAEKLVRTLAATDFYGHMATGGVIGGGGYASDGHWMAVELETINQGLWEAACRKE